MLVSDIPESERSQNIIKNWKEKIQKVKRGDNLFKIPLTMEGGIILFSSLNNFQLMLDHS